MFFFIFRFIFFSFFSVVGIEFEVASGLLFFWFGVCRSLARV